MSELLERPDLMMEILAKLVHRAGGYLRVTSNDPPSGPFDLQSRVDLASGVIELRLPPH